MDTATGKNYVLFPVAVSQTDLLLGTAVVSANTGIFLSHLIVSVATAATGTVSIKDSVGASAITITAANTPIGVYYVPLGVYSLGTTTTPGWYITTGAGATVIAVMRTLARG